MKIVADWRRQTKSLPHFPICVSSTLSFCVQIAPPMVDSDDSRTCVGWTSRAPGRIVPCRNDEIFIYRFPNSSLQSEVRSGLLSKDLQSKSEPKVMLRLFANEPAVRTTLRLFILSPTSTEERKENSSENSLVFFFLDSSIESAKNAKSLQLAPQTASDTDDADVSKGSIHRIAFFHFIPCSFFLSLLFYSFFLVRS